MKLKKRILNFINRIVYPHSYSSEVYIKYLRKKGAKIGTNTYFFDPTSNILDDGRLPYITIGNNCCITHGVEILCHDFSWSILRRSHNEILPDCGKPVTIGNNVFIGWDAIIMGDITIGSNVIIGAHSVVTHDIPDNSVAAGNPAKVIMTLDEYYQKKKGKELENAVNRAIYVYEHTGKKPSIKDMGWFGLLYLDRNKKNEEFLKQFLIKGDTMEDLMKVFYSTNKIFDSFDAFLDYAFNKKNSVLGNNLE